jgi:photosystem II stability/assembly factor-like uncharacterized protein
MSRIVSLVFLVALCVPAFAEWVPVGPPGGDARSLAVDPKRPNVLYAGTSDGIVYRSDDSAAHWRRLEPGFPLRGYSLDEMLVDERGRLLVAYWEIAGSRGGVARSDDGGQTFTLLPGIAGESVRALAALPGRPDVLVAGSLSGVFRSEDGGQSWKRISPAGHDDLKNVESVALDPHDPEVVYAGTWHLPWKTADGGRTWHPIKDGMIDDSDVFTMTLDRRRAETIYGTACSGIYRSLDGGARWAKIKGIPSSSRRTRAFVQHPAYPQVFFAGTTEGLWRTDDDLATWRLVTTKALVVNAIVVLPGGAILAGCDGAGILRSIDRGETWSSANEGFSERFVSHVFFDPATGRVLAGIREDRQHGGVLAAPAALHGGWSRLAPGLEGREVFTVARIGESLLAGTDDGVFRLSGASERWEPSTITWLGIERHGGISGLATQGPATVYAASPLGLLRSRDAGRTWEVVVLGVGGSVDAVATGPGGGVYAATHLGFFYSKDGQAFVERPVVPAPVHRLLVTPDGVLAASLDGLYKSSADVTSWRLCQSGLPTTDIAAIEATADGATVLASDFRNGGLYRSTDGGRTWTLFPTPGLHSDRLWTVAVDPGDPQKLLAAAVTGGLHRFEAGAAPSASSGVSAGTR